MKNFSYLAFLSLLFCSISCRKPDISLQNTAFTHGRYFYDYQINGSIYENYKTLQIYLHEKRSRKTAYLSEEDNYEIPAEENEFSYFWGGDEYLLSGGCLYDRYPNACRSVGLLSYSTYYIYFPNYYTGLTKVDLYGCEGKLYGTHTITDYDQIITIRGKDYKTYRIELYHQSQSTYPKLVGYIDAEIGLIKLEKYDVNTNQLISVLTFNHKEKF